ncbi:MAG: delta-lactam-biosynthetic de-N-acetylase [Oscillospiraceae bacterium]|nr:delta-lactam-biosynthetic de-N-acetylase [Oscillospiraceae bacterium]
MKIIYKVLSLIFIISIFNVFGATKEWGLSYPELGKTPVGNETKDYLKQFGGYFMGDPNEKVVYLTFDSGYENGYTEKILDVLKKNEVPATFFLVGHYLKGKPEIVKRMVNEGHIVGNHTMKHPDMTKISSKEAFSKELSQVEDLYKSITGQEMKKFYRPPQGKYSEQNLKMAKELGYKTIFWSVAYRDYDNNNQPSKEEAFSKLIPRIHNGAVVLLHNTSKSNSLILDELIGKYKGMGFEFRSLEDLVK